MYKRGLEGAINCAGLAVFERGASRIREPGVNAHIGKYYCIRTWSYIDILSTTLYWSPIKVYALTGLAALFLDITDWPVPSLPRVSALAGHHLRQLHHAFLRHVLSVHLGMPVIEPNPRLRHLLGLSDLLVVP